MNNFSWYNTNECSTRGMKDSIGEKQVKVFMMKKFLIVIFSIFGLMVGMLALMAIEYQISYNKWKSSYTGKIVTNSEEKYSTSSDGNKDDFESSKQEYATSSSSTKNYDYKNDGSFGKVKAGLELVYQKKTVQASLIRNVIKFLPWQLGHMGTIHGFYSDFDVLSIILSISATLLAVLLLAMTIFRKDKRHLGDLLAHTQVQQKGD